MGGDEVEDGNEDVRTVLSGAAGGPPPLGFDAASVIEHGGRIRRRRKRLAVAASSTATVAVIAAVALTVGLRGAGGPVTPVEPAGPGLSVTTIQPPPPTPSEAPAQDARPELSTPGSKPGPGPSRSLTPPRATTSQKSIPPTLAPGRTVTPTVPAAPTKT
jgi:hypothetical protein